MTIHLVYRSCSVENRKRRPDYYNKWVTLLSFIRGAERLPDADVVFVNDGPIPGDKLELMKDCGRVLSVNGEPVSNVATSLGEDMLFAGGMWALVHQPLLFLGGLAVFFILALLLIWALWKFIKRVFRRPPRPLAGA